MYAKQDGYKKPHNILIVEKFYMTCFSQIMITARNRL